MSYPQPDIRFRLTVLGYLQNYRLLSLEPGFLPRQGEALARLEQLALAY